jgi:iron(III) transport system permease protein
MISPLIVESPGRWRYVATFCLLGLCAVPAAPLLWESVTGVGDVAAVLTPAFRRGLLNSLLVAVIVFFVSVGVGLPLGALISLYRVRASCLLLSVLALPLLLPSFLPAIGWSSLAVRLGAGVNEAINGMAGCVAVFCAVGIPLALLGTVAACQSLTASQIEAARLSGGERAVFYRTVQYALLPSIFAAALSAILSMSDPGPGQIFGMHTASAEVLTTLSAQYDFVLAGRQSVILALVVLVLLIPALWAATPRLAVGLLARQTRRAESMSAPSGHPAAVALLLVSLVLVAFPLCGLLLPIAAGLETARALSELSRTWMNTLVYAVVAGSLATFIGLGFALCVGRHRFLLMMTLIWLAALFVLPPALGALGLLRIRGAAPASLNALLSTRLAVATTLAMRFVPIAALLLIRAWGSTAPSWTHVAAVQGVRLSTYLSRVTLPALYPAIAVVAVLVALLAASDVVTVLLLHPPGEASLPLAIFTIMANAPESLVASLCLVQIIIALTVLIVLGFLARGVRR